MANEPYGFDNPWMSMGFDGKSNNLDQVYSVIYIYNLISAGRNLAHKEKKTNGRCKRFHDRELPLPTYNFRPSDIFYI